MSYISVGQDETVGQVDPCTASNPALVTRYTADGKPYCARKPAETQTVVKVTTTYADTTAKYYAPILASFLKAPLAHASGSEQLELFKLFGISFTSDPSIVYALKKKMATADGQNKLTAYFNSVRLPRLKAAYQKRLDSCKAAGLPDDPNNRQGVISTPIGTVTQAHYCSRFLEPWQTSSDAIAKVLGWPPEGSVRSSPPMFPTNYQQYVTTDTGKKNIIKRLYEQYLQSASRAAGGSIQEHRAQFCETLPPEYKACCEQALKSGIGFTDFVAAVDKQDPKIMQCVYQSTVASQQKKTKTAVLAVSVAAAAAAGILFLKGGF